MPPKPESNTDSSETTKELVKIVAEVCDLLGQLNNRASYSADISVTLMDLKDRLGQLSRKL